MKQMRSRFRLITLVLVCVFVLTMVLCTGTVLKAAGISFSSLSSISLPGVSSSPDPSVSPDLSASPDTSVNTDATPLPPDYSPAAGDPPGTDNSPAPEYNIFGL